jgi:hypothetical protein
MRTSAAASIALELTILTPEDSRASRGVFPPAHAHEPMRRIRPARLAQVPGLRWTAAAALWTRRGHSLMRWRDPGDTRLECALDLRACSMHGGTHAAEPGNRPWQAPRVHTSIRIEVLNLGFYPRGLVSTRTTIQFLKLYGVFNTVRNGSERLRKAAFV